MLIDAVHTPGMSHEIADALSRVFALGGRSVVGPSLHPSLKVLHLRRFRIGAASGTEHCPLILPKGIMGRLGISPVNLFVCCMCMPLCLYVHIAGTSFHSFVVAFFTPA
jgi:hypothetical protein